VMMVVGVFVVRHVLWLLGPGVAAVLAPCGLSAAQGLTRSG